VPAGFADDAAHEAFRKAIHAVEGSSSAEVVVSVRRQSAPWLHAHLIAGILGGIAAHAYMLYASQPFSTSALLAGPIGAGAIIGLASTVVLGVKRWFTPVHRRRAAVRTAARASFVDRGIGRTSGKTGILVYVSIVEQMAEVIADDGVAACIADGEWAERVAAIDAAVAHGGRATATAVAALAPLLARHLPRGADDVNELPDDLHVHEDHHP
jgi:putative membrane protein